MTTRSNVQKEDVYKGNSMGCLWVRRGIVFINIALSSLVLGLNFDPLVEHITIFWVPHDLDKFVCFSKKLNLK